MAAAAVAVVAAAQVGRRRMRSTCTTCSARRPAWAGTWRCTGAWAYRPCGRRGRWRAGRIPSVLTPVGGGAAGKAATGARAFVSEGNRETFFPPWSSGQGAMPANPSGHQLSSQRGCYDVHAAATVCGEALCSVHSRGVLSGENVYEDCTEHKRCLLSGNNRLRRPNIFSICALWEPIQPRLAGQHLHSSLG